MFEYVKSYFNEELDKLNNEYLQCKDKKQLIEAEQKIISDVERLRLDYKSDKKNLIGSLTSLVMMTVLFVVTNYNIIMGLSFIPLLILIRKEIKWTKETKIKLNEKYIKLMEISKNSLEEANQIEYLKRLEKIDSYKKLDKEIVDKVNEILIKKIEKEEDNIKKLQTSAKEINQSIDNIETYEFISESGICKFKDAKTEEDFRDIYKKEFYARELLKEFLEEEPKYCSIERCDELGEEIQYKEKAKQFVKSFNK